MKKTFFLWIFLFLLFASFPLYQLLALRGIALQHFTIEEIGMNRYLQFTIKGAGELSNPSIIPVTIKQMRYQGYIHDEKVLEGTIEEMTIRTKGTASFSFDEEIDWVPDAETAEDIILGKDIILRIEIESDAEYLFFFTITGKKEKEISINRLLKPYVEEQLTSLSQKIMQFF